MILLQKQRDGKTQNVLDPKCVTHTKSTMLTQNTTVAPDRHKRAHLLVTGKYGSISWITSKQKHRQQSQSPHVTHS